MTGSGAARATARPVLAPRPSAASRGLMLVPRAAHNAPRAPFIGMVVGLLALALLSLLVLNTQIAQNSFTVASLQARNTTLDDQQQALQQQVDSQAASNTLAARAGKLGMVPAGQPAFIRLPDGTVLGQPKPAVRPPTINIRGVGPGHAPGATDPSGSGSSTSGSPGPSPSPGPTSSPGPSSSPQPVTSTSGGTR